MLEGFDGFFKELKVCLRYVLKMLIAFLHKSQAPTKHKPFLVKGPTEHLFIIFKTHLSRRK